MLCLIQDFFFHIFNTGPNAAFSEDVEGEREKAFPVN